MITEITFPDKFAANLGLKPSAPLRRLGNLVVLAGPNGAGKTRYLKLLKTTCEILKNQNDFIKNFSNHKLDFISVNERNRLNANLEEALRDMELVKIDGLPSTENIKSLSPIVYLDYALSDNRIIDSNGIAPNQAANYYDNIYREGFKSTYDSQHIFLNKIARNLFNSKHEDLKIRDDVKELRQDADKFNGIIRALLVSEVTYDLDSNNNVIAKIFDRPYNQIELSKGQKILLTWAITIHHQAERLKDVIILIDEPETHLHPSVCIDALRRLQQDVLGPKGQIWLATHSVPLIAYAGMESVYLVKDNSIEYAGNRVGEVIDSLMGGPDGRYDLERFLTTSDAIGLAQFAAQCVLPPGIASYQENDKQQKQFLEVISGFLKNGETLRILDYGAGKGRFAAAMVERRKADEYKNKIIEYHAFNPKSATDCKEECLKQLKNFYGDGEDVEKHYYHDDMLNIGVGRSPKMNLVVLCNVLHEVEVGHWYKLFKELLFNATSDNAWIILMEDHLLSVGELPNPDGFLVLDEFAIMELFNASNQDVTLLDQQDSGRLKAVGIKKNVLQNISSDTIIKALNHVRRKAHSRIIELREDIRRARAEAKGKQNEKALGRLGKEYAFFAALATNAQLAAEKFGAK